MQTTNRSSSGRAAHLALAATITTIALQRAALGQDIQVQNIAAGAARIQQSGQNTTIHAADKTIINYHQFNVANDAHVRFVQPSSLSRVLNRITGPDPSTINGTISANGIVYLVNPAGVMFGPGSVIDVGGIVAAAGNITNRNFLNNIDHFITGSGTVSNFGTIQADAFAHLVGEQAINAGSIVTDGGIVTMTSGEDVYLGQEGHTVLVRVDGVEAGNVSRTTSSLSSPATMQAGVLNDGDISGNEIVFAAGDLYSLALINNGNINAPGGSVIIQGAGNAINRGQINTSSSSTNGGLVSVHADRVLNSGQITADSDQAHAGSVSITSTSKTVLASGSQVSAAGGQGIAEGGQILIHAFNGDTRMMKNAIVDISGGQAGGNGGFAEISAADSLEVRGKLLGTAAPGYDPAKILLDPTNILISDASGPDDGDLTDGEILLADSAAADMQVTPGAIETFDGNVLLEASNDIAVSSAIDKSNGGLTLDAGRDIAINANINATFFEATAGRHITGAGLPNITTTDIVGATGSGSDPSGDAGAFSPGIILASGETIDGGTVSGIGALTVAAGNGVAIFGDGDLEIGGAGVASIAQSTSTHLLTESYAGIVSLPGNHAYKSLTAFAGTNINLGGTSTVTNEMVVDALGNVTIGGNIAAGFIDIVAGGNITGSGSPSITASGVSSDFGYTASVETQDTAIPAGISLAAGLETAGSTIGGFGTLAVPQDGAILLEQSADISYPNAAMATVANPAATALGLTSTGGSLAIADGQTVVAIQGFAAGALTTGSITADGDISLLTGGDATINGNLAGAGVEIIAGGNVVGAGSTTLNAATGTLKIATGVSEGSEGGSGTITGFGNLTAGNLIQTLGSFVLGADTTFDALFVELLGPVNGAPDVSAALTITGSVFFESPIGAAVPLASLVVQGLADIFGGTIQTTGGQSYAQAVYVGADTLFESSASGDILFSDTLNGSHGINVNTGGDTTFNGIVGGTDIVAFLRTDAPGQTFINADMYAQGGTLAFGDTVSLLSDVTLTDTGGTGIFFNSTLNGAHRLTVNSAADAFFGDTIGGTTPLTDLLIFAGGTVTLPDTTTTGNFTVSSNDIDLTGTSYRVGGDIDFTSTPQVIGDGVDPTFWVSPASSGDPQLNGFRVFATIDGQIVGTGGDLSGIEGTSAIGQTTTSQDEVQSSNDAILLARLDQFGLQVEGADVLAAVGRLFDKRNPESDTDDKRITVAASNLDAARTLASKLDGLNESELQAFGLSLRDELRAFLSETEPDQRRSREVAARSFVQTWLDADSNLHAQLNEIGAIFDALDELGLSTGDIQRVEQRLLAYVRPEGISDVDMRLLVVQVSPEFALRAGAVDQALTAVDDQDD